MNAMTGSAAVDLPWEMKVHTTSPMQLSVVSDVARGGGGCMPAEMPCAPKLCFRKPKEAPCQECGEGGTCTKVRSSSVCA